MRISVVLALTGALCLPLLHAAPAQAQATRTWVSGGGDDANPCARTAPCKSFIGAISKTAAGGEINCLDSGGFGGLTITKSIIISCEAGTAGVAVSKTNGITVAVAATDTVTLRGLDIDGGGTGLIGISFTKAGALHVEKCIIRGFASGAALGISFAPTAAGELYVEDSYISDNGTGTTGGGIFVQPAAGGSALAVLNRVSTNNNIVGVRADGTGNAGVKLSIQSSTSAGSAFGGIVAIAPAGGGTVSVLVDQSDISNNGANGLAADGAAATLRFARSIVTGNGTSVTAVNGATLLSYGDNDIDGNGTNTLPGTTAHH